ncbi:Phospholipase ABHD3 [Orchesella cincta]|uniref:Phospholipase ABHD3 n=1 Tax=Orchesella cincta TaxID=48709 RepID=A0A1D2MTN5_ORCCI|nr:Phospholipase ABHD3 [Orchesella cincta]
MYESVSISMVSAASAAAAFFATYYTFYASQKPQVFASSLKLRNFLDEHVQLLKERYWPSPLYAGGHLQTILGLSQRVTSPNKLPYRREIFTLSDGGEVALDYMEIEQKSERPLMVLFLPGLTSSSHTSYVRTLVQTINKSGASVVVFNNRGNGGVPFKTPKTYSASYIGDLEEVIAHLKQKYPETRFVGLGTSLGGMVLAKYLVTKPLEAKNNFECALLLCIAWDCVQGSENLEKPFINKYLINKELARGLRRLAKKFIDKFPDVSLKFDPKLALSAKTVREFDSAVTAPQFGFPNVLEYYKSATTSGHVHKLSIPVFALSAEDDPMCPGHLLPREEAVAENSKLALITTARGGHLGYLEGFGKSSTHYMERLVGQLVEGIRVYGGAELTDLSNGHL